MGKRILLKVVRQFDSNAAMAVFNGCRELRTLKASAKQSLLKSNAGFTFIEVMIVTLMIGILSAIAIPSWAAFIDRQRLNAANDVVLNALRQAQSEAKRTKQSHSVSFRTVNNEPRIAVHLASNTSPTWGSLGLELKPGQILLGTNLSAENIASSSTTYASGTARRITFNYMGILQPAPNLGNNNQGLIVAVGIPQSASSNQAVAATRRCTKVVTLLGTIQTGKGNECQ